MSAPFAWAGGWVPSAAAIPLGWRPRGGRELGLPTAAWSVDHRDDEVRTIVTGAVTLTVIGHCLASDAELRSAAACARSGDFRPVASFGGSYTTVVHCHTETVLIGDLAGTARLYFAPAYDGHLWATAATPVAAYLQSSPRLEPMALDLAIHGLELYGGEVPYDRVHAVAPGSLLRLTPESARVERWDDPAADSREVPRFELTAARFGERLLDAVERRTARAALVTGDLSGGTGSGTLMYLASQSTKAWGITYADFPKAGLDAARIARECGPALYHDVIAKDPGTLHYAGLTCPGELPVTDLPSGDLAVLGPDRAILEHAAALGSQHHLIGVGDDELLSARPSTLATLYRAGRRRDARRGARALARSQRSSPRRTIRAVSRLANTSYDDALCAVAARVLRGRLDGQVEPDDWALLSWLAPTAAAGWLTPDARQAVAATLLSLRDAGPLYPTPEAREDWQEIRRGAADIHAYLALARQLAITVHTPYYDTPLLHSALSVPGHARELPPHYKPLVTVGLRSVLPPAITNATGKDHNNVLHTDQDGLAAHATDLRELLASSALVKAGVLDHTALNTYLERAIAGIDAAHRSLVRWISQELWLRDSDTQRTTWWEIP